MHLRSTQICILPLRTSGHLYCLPAVETADVPQPFMPQLPDHYFISLHNPLIVSVMCVERYFILRVLYKVMGRSVQPMASDGRGRGCLLSGCVEVHLHPHHQNFSALSRLTHIPFTRLCLADPACIIVSGHGSSPYPLRSLEMTSWCERVFMPHPQAWERSEPRQTCPRF